MAEYVNIKRSKNLRFKLISLMYLIFLVLSVIQIPISWLKVTPYIHDYIERPTITFQDTVLANFSKQLETTDEAFKIALGYNPQTGKISESNSYSITDEFFLKSDNGKALFVSLIKLQNWANQLPDGDSRKERFKHLFADDIENGLAKANSQDWLTYRWKHVPAVLARNLIEELNLRTKLLNKGDIVETEQAEEPLLSLMTGYSYLRVGDQANLSAKGDSLIEVKVTREGRPTSDYTVNGNKILFKPNVAGLYTISVKGKIKAESLEIKVLPAGFPKKEALPFRICYTGVSYAQKVEITDLGARLYCAADPEANLDAKTGLLSFRPNKEGWCAIKINSGEGLVFDDSVFVKPLPDPIFGIKELPALKISRKRLQKMAALDIIAMHPSIKNGVYKIESYQLKWVGSNPSIEKIDGNQIPLKGKNLEQTQYIIIYDIDVQMGIEKKKFEQPIIIQII